MAFEHGVDRELRTGECGDDPLDRVDPAAPDRIGRLPRPRGAVGVDRVGAQRRRVGERDDRVSVGAHHPVHLSKHPIEVIDQAQGPHRHGDVDLVGADEGEFGRAGFVKLDGDLVVVGEAPGSGELIVVGVGRHDSSAATGEADGGVAGTAAEVENALAPDLAQQPPVELGAELRPELDMIERSRRGGPRVIARHTGTLRRGDLAPEGGVPSPVMAARTKLGLQDVAKTGGIDYRLAREATLSAFRDGDLSREQVCDAQKELVRNAEFCGTPAGRDCPICETATLVEVTYVFGPRLPKHGRCVTSDKEMARLAARKSSSQGYVVEVCPVCRWNHLTETRSIGGS